MPSLGGMHGPQPEPHCLAVAGHSGGEPAGQTRSAATSGCSRVCRQARARSTSQWLDSEPRPCRREAPRGATEARIEAQRRQRGGGYLPANVVFQTETPDEPDVVADGDEV